MRFSNIGSNSGVRFARAIMVGHSEKEKKKKKKKKRGADAKGYDKINKNIYIYFL
jgi:hypothetical protein